jgi:hypothetical protein
MLLLAISFAPVICGQESHPMENQDKASFLIDQSKPYLYLLVEQIIVRNPLRPEEPKVGLALRLVNNSRLSIVLMGSKPSSEGSSDARWIADEVVPDKPSTGTESTAAGVGYRKGQEGLTDIFRSPNDVEAEVRGAEAKAKAPESAPSHVRPQGYNQSFQPGPAFLNVIPPGGEVSFSLPSDHVSPTWHLEIPFRFALTHRDGLRQPYSYVALFWDDIPEADRLKLTKLARTQSSPSADSSSHEVDHARGTSAP